MPADSRDERSAGLYFLTFGFCLLLLTLRAWPRVSHLEIWAEDGYVFLPEALRMGWTSVGLTYSGFYSVIPRALTVIWSDLLPPARWAAAINLSALAMMAAVLAMPVGRTYAWLIADIRARFLLCAILCLAPGLNEMAGNYANLPWLFFFAVAFLGLRDPRDPIPFWAVLLSGPLLASTAEAVFAIPLFVWRTFESIRARRSRAHVWSSAAMLAALCLSVLALWISREPRVSLVLDAPPLTLFRAFLKTTGDSLLLLPWLGDRIASALTAMATPWPRLAALAAAGVLLGSGVFRFWRRPDAQAVILFAAGVLCWPVVNWVARPGNLPAFLHPLDDWTIRHRYAFPSAVAASFVWMFLLQAGVSNRRWKMGLSLVLLVAGLGVGTDRFRIRAYGPEWKWDRLVWFIDRARATGCPNPIVGSIYPGRWTFEYEDPRRPRCEAP